MYVLTVSPNPIWLLLTLRLARQPDLDSTLRSEKRIRHLLEIFNFFIFRHFFTPRIRSPLPPCVLQGLDSGSYASSLSPGPFCAPAKGAGAASLLRRTPPSQTKTDAKDSCSMSSPSLRDLNLPLYRTQLLVFRRPTLYIEVALDLNTPTNILRASRP